MPCKIRPIAIYLPQFHPVRENDEWWGKGFTEWTNVTKAKPLFKGHYQPHLPTDLGFCDLRVPEVREEQAKMAREYGIHGFCYYHYWFNGKRILERPFQEVFESGSPDFPFMLCWANENWTRTWDGKESNVLLEQNYSAEDYRNHVRSLIPYFKDERYIRIDGKPVFSIYKTQKIPNIQELIDIFRAEARKEGIELYLCRFETDSSNKKSYAEGFDAAVEFQPHGGIANYIDRFWLRKMWREKQMTFENLVISLRYRYNRLIKSKGLVIDYKKFIKVLSEFKADEGYKRYRGVTPGFDNTARKRSNYFLMKNATPEVFGQWVDQTLSEFKPFSKEENLFFINAWNEWAEGNHLEPCVKWGRQYLEELKKNIDRHC
jgi:lipopolysaccharide biosynthesis protein